MDHPVYGIRLPSPELPLFFTRSKKNNYYIRILKKKKQNYIPHVITIYRNARVSLSRESQNGFNPEGRPARLCGLRAMSYTYIIPRYNMRNIPRHRRTRLAPIAVDGFGIETSKNAHRHDRAQTR